MLFPDLYEHGKWVHEHLEPDWMVDGHVMTGVEMMAHTYYLNTREREHGDGDIDGGREAGGDPSS